MGEYKFDDNDGDEDTFNLAWMKMHANYNAKTFENDIAILKLDRKVTFSDSIKAACLPFADVDYVDKKATVAGWGTIYFGGPTSQRLLEVDVGIWKNSDCANNYARLNRNVLDTMMCAGDASGGGDACQVMHIIPVWFSNNNTHFLSALNFIQNNPTALAVLPNSKIL